MTIIALVYVINHPINGLHLFWDTLYEMDPVTRVQTLDENVYIYRANSFKKGIDPIILFNRWMNSMADKVLILVMATSLGGEKLWIKPC